MQLDIQSLILCIHILAYILSFNIINMKLISIISFFILIVLAWCGASTQEENTNESNWVIISEDWDTENWTIPSVSAFPDQAFRALWTEPFWSFTYDNQNFDWSEPGEEDILEQSHFVQQVFLESDATYYITWDFIAIQIFEETCSDGMSDNIFDYTVTWNYFDMELNWCAEAL